MTTEQPLANIESVALREVWPNEASNFTPWLAEHITELGEALGIPLETGETESPVGSRSLDILATNTNSGHPVIIENQLSYSGGDHLSRLLIYAAGKDADLFIWIASEFEEEHWLVLQWLNQRTGTETKFFGVTIEVWRIDGSPAAPYFRVVAAPNDWRKRNVNDRRPVAPREMRRRHRDFRTELEERLRLEPDLPLEPGSDHNNPWLAISDAHGLRYSVDFRNRIYLSFQMDTRSNQSLECCYSAFDRLARDKDAIECALGQLEWTRRWQGTRGSQIASHYPGTISDLSDSWAEVHSWVIERYRRFRTVFEPYREELLSSP